MTDTSPQTPELLPCPFCGAVDGVYSEQMGPAYAVARCSNCNATHCCNTEAEAIVRWKNRADAAEAHSLLLREALQLLLANMLDHQGCPMPGHLISTCEKLAKAVLSTPIPDSVSRLTRLKPSQGDNTDG